MQPIQPPKQTRTSVHQFLPEQQVQRVLDDLGMLLLDAHHKRGKRAHQLVAQRRQHAHAAAQHGPGHLNGDEEENMLGQQKNAARAARACSGTAPSWTPAGGRRWGRRNARLSAAAHKWQHARSLCPSTLARAPFLYLAHRSLRVDGVPRQVLADGARGPVLGHDEGHALR